MTRLPGPSRGKTGGGEAARRQFRNNRYKQMRKTRSAGANETPPEWNAV